MTLGEDQKRGMTLGEDQKRGDDTRRGPEEGSVLEGQNPAVVKAEVSLWLKEEQNCRGCLMTVFLDMTQRWDRCSCLAVSHCASRLRTMTHNETEPLKRRQQRSDPNARRRGVRVLTSVG